MEELQPTTPSFPPADEHTDGEHEEQDEHPYKPPPRYEYARANINNNAASTTTVPRPRQTVTGAGDAAVKMPLTERIWAWELGASLFSIACVGGITALLALIDNMPLAHWQRSGGKMGHYVSPTFLASMLSTVGQSTCMLALAEILSRLKWVHFAGPKAQPLSDLQVFDRASRGPWGALRMLFSRQHKRILVFFACLAMVLALIMDPFVQLVFSFPQRPSAAFTATGDVATAPPLRSTTVYDPHGVTSSQQCSGPTDVDIQLQAAIVSPIWNAMRLPNISCNYDSCAWPDMTTLGVCGNIYDEVPTVGYMCNFNGTFNTGDYSVVCNTTIYDDTNNELASFISIFETVGGVSYEPRWNSSVAVNNKQGVAYYDLDNSAAPPSVELVTVRSIKYTFDRPWQEYIVTDGQEGSSPSNPSVERFPWPTMEQVSLSLCARTYFYPKYENGSAYTTVPDEGWASGAWPLNVSYVPPASGSGESLVNLTPLTPIDINGTGHVTQNLTFQINQCAYQDLAQYLAELFTTSYTETNATVNSPSAPVIQTVKSEMGRALYQIDDMQKLMANIAESMTDVIRNSANSTATPGTGYDTVTFISVSWPFVALPWLVEVLTFVLLVATIVNSRGDGLPAWKSSNAAMLFHGLAGWNTPETMAAIANPAELAAQTQNLRARVGLDENGRRVFVRG